MYSFDNELIAYYVSGNILDARDTAVNKMDKNISSFMGNNMY
jgi:hypothetical protein